MRPDHVPTLEGELNSRPGYETLGRLFAIGYIRGLEQSVYGHPSTRGVA
jgi:mannonate dehydratase